MLISFFWILRPKHWASALSSFSQLSPNTSAQLTVSTFISNYLYCYTIISCLEILHYVGNCSILFTLLPRNQSKILWKFKPLSPFCSKHHCGFPACCSLPPRAIIFLYLNSFLLPSWVKHSGHLVPRHIKHIPDCEYVLLAWIVCSPLPLYQCDLLPQCKVLLKHYENPFSTFILHTCNKTLGPRPLKTCLYQT